MILAAPLVLAFLAFAAVPILLHLVRRSGPRVPFPATEILLRVAHRRNPLLRLRSLALLVVRVLLIAILVLAVARPELAVERQGGVRGGPAVALALVLDDSLSMRLADDHGRPIFDAARDLALAELGTLRPGDAAALILAGRPARALREDVDFDLPRVAQELRRTRPGYGRGDLSRATELAMRLLDDSPLPRREILLLTDLADPSVTKATALIAHGSGLTLRVVDAGAATARRNAAVTRIEVTPDAGGAPREYAIEAEVTNHSERPLSGVEVGLEVDGAERSRARLDVPAHGSAVQRFHQRFAEEGVHRGLVRLAADRLPDDDVRHFAVEVRESLQTLVINGEPRPGSYHDETFYLQRALTTAVPGEPSIRPVVIDAETARSTTLTGHDAVILAGLTKIDLALAGRLADWVMEGGGLLVSAGGQTAPDWGALESVLPARVRGLAGRPRGERARGLAGVLRSHPLFAAYGNGPTGLEATRVQMHLLVEPDPKAERRILSELEGGFPLILERQVRSGRVLLLTTSLDRDWTDLPIRPGYLPLVQRAVRYLADSLDAQGPRRIEIGDAVPLEVSPGMLRLVVRPPDGQDVEFSANDLAGRNRISFSATGRPGPYRVWVETPGFGGLREVPALDFVAELAPDESDPTRRALPATPGTASMAGATGRLPLWSWFLLAAFVLVVVESFLAGLGLRRSHLEQGVARLLAASLGWGRAGLGSLERFGHRRFSFSPRPGPSRRS